jgi:hypothetical protein
MRFGLGNPAVVGAAVYGQYNTATTSGIARLDLSTGRLERIVAFPEATSGSASIVVSPPWLAWTLGNASDNVFDWTVFARNIDTGETLTLAQSRRSDGTFLPGQQPLLAIRDATLSWAQALPGPLTQYETELHRYDLAARRDQVLASGRVSAPVYAGDMLIWAQRDSAGTYGFRVVDAGTLAARTTPPGLRDPGSIISLAGSRDAFGWTAEGLLDLHVWRLDTNEVRTFHAPDIKHYFQFMQFAGDFVLWYSGVTSAILDLRSGAFVDVPGSLAAGSDVIVMERPTGTPAAKGQFVASRVALAPAAALAPLSCTP